MTPPDDSPSDGALAALLTGAAPLAHHESASGDPLWYKDAIIYQLHVKAFFDANNDGIGDFDGLSRKLDYLHDLGVTALWLLPFYPSPLRDDGYDIAAYRDINPTYGRMADFKAFIKAAHRRDGIASRGACHLGRAAPRLHRDSSRHGRSANRSSR